MHDLPASRCLELNEACTPVPSSPLGARLRSWHAAEVEPARCIIELDAAARDELAAMDEAIRNTPMPVVERHAGQFRIPRLRKLMAHAKRALDTETGVAVLDRLPLSVIDQASALTIFWCLGGLIGAQVAQKWDGTQLYDVADHGLPFGYGVRGSFTNVELPFHTDNAFGVAPPWYVGLLCIRPAESGGVSRFCSLVAVHDRLWAEHPAQLARLYQPMLWDRQAEHEPGAPPVAAAPMFRYHDSRLSVRANPMLVRKGYAVAEQTMDDALDAALAAFQALTDDREFWFELPIERGQVQYLNNIDIAHYRSEFHDAEDAACKRHLVRTWHRDAGSTAYDG